MAIDIILGLLNKFGNLFVFAFILTRIKSYRNLISKKPVRLFDKLILSVVFGIFGIIGTYFSIEFEGALVNTRIIGVATGGLLGGPFVGLLSGLIAGIHRGLINAGGFTTTACAISTVFEGLMSGYMGKLIQDKKNKWMYAALTGAIAESMRKVSVLLFSKPFFAALALVKAIWIPMVIINSLGLALLFMIIENIFSEQEKISAEKAQLALKIAEKCLPFLKKGISSPEIKEVAKIIYDMTEFKAVTITDKEKIITHFGLATYRHREGGAIVTESTKEVLETGKVIIMDHCIEPACDCDDCPLKSSIILPLKENDNIVGTLKLYKDTTNAITSSDIELVNGLAKLFSTQLTLGKLEQNSKLLASAELKALQAQINPHFLFNSLAVIGSLCRTKPEKARDLVFHLGNIFRSNLNMNKELVELDIELNNVKSYVEIESARFEDKLNVVYEIGNGVRCLIPPLTLQPIVENAIKHGLLPKKNGGIVKITALREDNMVVINIEDDGIGIEKGRIKQLLNSNNTHKDSLGLNNVNERLKAIFGENHKLQIDSEIGKGTSVTVRIPVIEN